MIIVPLTGALLIVCGIVYMARAAIFRGGLSDPGPTRDDTAVHTLEPRHDGLGFLAPRANWPGLVMLALGAVMLLLPALL